MKKNDVSQDKGIYGDWKAVNYAASDDGHLGPVLSAGWNPANVANGLFHQHLDDQLSSLRLRVEAGELSVLAYHMAYAQMDVSLLSEYSGLTRRQIKQHLVPENWQNLDSASRKIYADLFDVPPDQLDQLPTPS